MSTRVRTAGSSWTDAVGSWMLDHGLKILLILVVATVLRFVLRRAVRRLVRRSVDSRLGEVLDNSSRAVRALASATGATHERRRQRTETLGSVLSSMITAAVYGIAFLMVLSEFDVDLAPLLASAGVAGVALGFGAQSLVKDFLSGVFMLLEDQYGVGDLIDTGEATGTVEEVTLRITKLRDPSGVAWYVRNGEIIRIGNKSQGWSTAVVDLPVAYTEDVERVLEIIRGVVLAVYQDPEWAEKMLEEPTVAGVEQITGTTITIRVFAKTAPDEHWGVQREIREQAKAAFDAAGVQAPVVYPSAPGNGSGAGSGVGSGASPAAAAGATPAKGTVTGTV